MLMKNFVKSSILTLAVVVCGLSVLTSCSKDDNYENLIVGTWDLVKYDANIVAKGEETIDLKALIDEYFETYNDSKANNDVVRRLVARMEEKGCAGNIKFIHVALPDVYVEHGNVSLLHKEVGIDADSIVEKIEKI